MLSCVKRAIKRKLDAWLSAKLGWPDDLDGYLAKMCRGWFIR